MAATDTALTAASLISSIKAGRKDGKVYSYKPTDRSGDFDFSRGSDIEASENIGGTLVFSKVNLLDNPQWEPVAYNAAPHTWSGTLIGDGYFDLGASSGQIRFTSPTGSDRAFLAGAPQTDTGVKTLSVQVDTVHTSGCTLLELLGRGGSATALLYLENGLEVASSTVVTAGNVYSIVFNVTGSWTPRIGIGTGSAIAGDLTLSNPQLNYGIVADDYVEQGVPMVYGESANALTAPNDFDDAAWTASQLTITEGQTDKDGGTTATLITGTSTSSQFLSQSIDYSDDGVLKITAKANTTDFITLYGVGNDEAANFDLGTGTTSSAGASMIDEGSGWYTCVFNVGNAGKTQWRLYVMNGLGSFTYSIGDSVYIQDASLDWRSGERVDTANNELTAPNDFDDAAWTNSATTETSGQIDKDGGTAAWQLDKSAAGGSISQTISGTGVQTLGFFLKAGTLNWASISVAGPSGVFQYFDLSNGALGTAGGSVNDASIQPAGNGYYLCSITFEGATTSVQLFPADGDSDVSGTSGNIYIQDARLAEGNEILGYVQGLTADLPRINLPVGASCPSLLLEPSRQNQITNSNYIGASGWTIQSGNTVSYNTSEVTSPDGRNNATKIVSSDAATGFFFGGLTETDDAARTVYLRGAVGGETVDLKDPSGFGGTTSVTLTTEWVRYEHVTTNTGDTYQGLFVDNISVGTIYFYQAQFEEGSYATSLIPTYGASATRAADVSTKSSISSLIGQTSGTYYVDFTSNSGIGDLILINRSTTSSVVTFLTSVGTIRTRVYVGGSVVAEVNAITAVVGTNYKVAVVYDEATGVKMFVNGTKYETLTPFTFTIPLDTISIADTGFLQSGQDNVVSAAVAFTTTLTDDEAIALTTV